MISLEEVRQTVMADFQSVHTENYPDTLVNYPNIVVVDLEHQVDPFVSVELDFTRVTQAALGEKELLVPGTLFVNYYYRKGTGTAGAFNYTDMLNDSLCMALVGSIYYSAVKPIPIESFPGWEGIMNEISFDVG